MNEEDKAETEDGGEKFEELQHIFGGVIEGLSSAFVSFPSFIV